MYLILTIKYIVKKSYFALVAFESITLYRGNFIGRVFEIEPNGHFLGISKMMFTPGTFRYPVHYYLGHSGPRQKGQK